MARWGGGEGWRWVVLGIVALTALLLLGIAVLRHDQLAPPGSEITWDDFGLSVQEARDMPEVGWAGNRAGGAWMDLVAE